MSKIFKAKCFVVKLTRPRNVASTKFPPVSQFTLYANTKKGNKPDFHAAAKPEIARELYDYFFERVQSLYSAEKVKNGVFQAMMEVGIVNDGPVGVDYCSMDAAVKLSELESKCHSGFGDTADLVE